MLISQTIGDNRNYYKHPLKCFLHFSTILYKTKDIMSIDEESSNEQRAKGIGANYHLNG